LNKQFIFQNSTRKLFYLSVNFYLVAYHRFFERIFVQGLAFWCVDAAPELGRTSEEEKAANWLWDVALVHGKSANTLQAETLACSCTTRVGCFQADAETDATNLAALVVFFVSDATTAQIFLAV